MFLKDKFASGVISTKVWDNNSISEENHSKTESKWVYTGISHTNTGGELADKNLFQ